MTETDKLIHWILNARVELAAQRRELASTEHLDWLETIIAQANKQLRIVNFNYAKKNEAKGQQLRKHKGASRDDLLPIHRRRKHPTHLS